MSRLHVKTTQDVKNCVIKIFFFAATQPCDRIDTTENWRNIKISETNYFYHTALTITKRVLMSISFNIFNLFIQNL